MQAKNTYWTAFGLQEAFDAAEAESVTTTDRFRGFLTWIGICKPLPITCPTVSPV
jgi:hypothetical protein